MKAKRPVSAVIAGVGTVVFLAWAALSSGREQPPPVAGAIPAGVIVGWSGTVGSIPPGWQLCDGTKGTPDLRGQFIRGATTDEDLGETAGQAAYTTSQNQRHTTKVTRSGGFAAIDPTGGSGTLNIVSMHAHTVSVMPPYYTLAFIMKLADE